MIAEVSVIDGRWTAGFIPCWIDDHARPIPVTGGEGLRIVEYVRDISTRGGWETRIDWDGAMARIDLVTSPRRTPPTGTLTPDAPASNGR